MCKNNLCVVPFRLWNASLIREAEVILGACRHCGKVPQAGWDADPELALHMEDSFPS